MLNLDSSCYFFQRDSNDGQNSITFHFISLPPLVIIPLFPKKDDKKHAKFARLETKYLTISMEEKQVYSYSFQEANL